MRAITVGLLLLLFPAVTLGIEEDDVLFFAPFEGSAAASLARGASAAAVTGPLRFGQGIRGQAVATDSRTLLRYVMQGNCQLDEGTIMLWVKPEWRSSAPAAQHFFHASTGNFGGKALNSLMLYKHAGSDRLLFYTSNGAASAPAEGRTIATLEPAGREPNRWFHLAATWTSTLASTEMYLYVDGRRVGAAGGAVFVPEQMARSFEIGGPGGSATTWFDDVLVFSRPLLPREIAEIYSGYRAGGNTQAQELPFAPRRELGLRAYRLFGRRQLLVEADARSARRELAGSPGRIEIELSQAGRQLRQEVAADQQMLAKFPFPDEGLAPGPCQLTARLRNAAGKTLRTGQLDYTIPDRPVWLDNTLGKSDEVLPPWTPLGVDRSAVTMWGRRYECTGSPLPTAIGSQGRPLLRGPIGLAIRARGVDTPLSMQAAAPPAGNEAAVQQSWSGRLGPLACTAVSRTEFDGFLRLDFQLRPDRPVEVEGLTLTIPLRSDYATLYHHADGTWTARSDAGGIGPAGWSKCLPFVPYVWLGNEQGGLAWCCDENHGWHNADPQRAIELRRTGAGAELVLHIIDTQARLAEPFALSFGLMATPVKPLPPGWRDWRVSNVSGPVERFVKYLAPQAGCRNIANLWSSNIGAFSYLAPQPQEMQRKVALLRAHGWDTVVSYFALDYTQTGTPDYQVLEREWRRNPYRETDFPGGSYASVCNGSTWADFLVWAVARTLDETGTDGVYLDCTCPDFCASAEHGCAPGRYPILASRDLLRRIYSVVKQKRGARGFVYCHISENNILPQFSFADAVLNGEQYNRKDLQKLDLAKFRAEFSPQPYGVPAIVLPTLIKFQPGGREKMPGGQFLAFPLLHDTLCVGAWLSRPSQELLSSIQNALHEFGAADAEFLPYWAHSAEIQVARAEATVSGYLRHDGRALLLIARADHQPGTAAVALSGRLAAFRDRTARDPLAKQALSWDQGRLLWPLPDQAVRLCVIELEARAAR